MDFHDETITFTSDELTVISDILRRLDPAEFMVALFTGKDEFSTAFAKIEAAKHASFREIPSLEEQATMEDGK